jgi:hypothetical protein
MTRIFLLAGQSNMAGAGITAELTEQYTTSPEHVRLFEDGEFRDLAYADTFGPEIGFAHEIVQVYPDDNIILCKVATGGANLYYDWNPDGMSQGPEDVYRGPLYPKLINAISRLTMLLKDESIEPVITGMLWMQGERDSVFDFMAETYEQNLRAFIACIRRDTHVADLQVIVGQICPRVIILDIGKYNHAWRRTVQAAQRAVAEKENGVFLVPTDDIPQSDNLHFDTLGLLELGKRYARMHTLKGNV